MWEKVNDEPNNAQARPTNTAQHRTAQHRTAQRVPALGHALPHRSALLLCHGHADGDASFLGRRNIAGIVLWCDGLCSKAATHVENKEKNAAGENRCASTTRERCTQRQRQKQRQKQRQRALTQTHKQTNTQTLSPPPHLLSHASPCKAHSLASAALRVSLVPECRDARKRHCLGALRA